MKGVLQLATSSNLVNLRMMTAQKCVDGVSATDAMSQWEQRQNISSIRS